MSLLSETGSKIFGFISNFIIIIGLAYAGWKVYHSNFYRETLKRENGPGGNVVADIIVAVTFFLLYTAFLSVLTVLVPYFILYFLWRSIFGFY